MGIRLFVGGQGSTIQGEVNDLTGDRCFTAAYSPSRGGNQTLDTKNLNLLCLYWRDNVRCGRMNLKISANQNIIKNLASLKQFKCPCFEA